MTASRDPANWLPMAPRDFWMLLVLAEGPAHGYAILKASRASAELEPRLGPTTLYRTLTRMVEGGLVEAVAAPDPEADGRRQYYGLTPLGRSVVGAELARLERMVRLGRSVVRGPQGEGGG